jgi:hypothetical protein
MSSKIWTTPSTYGTYEEGTTKPVSNSTAYRWFKKDKRTKTRKSATMRNAVSLVKA